MSFDLLAFREMYAGMVANDHVLVDIMASDDADGYVTYPDIRAFVTSYKPQEVVEGTSLKVDDTKCVILAEDIPGAVTRLGKKDRIRLQTDGKAYAVMRWDDKTRRVGPDLIAVEVQLRG